MPFSAVLPNGERVISTLTSDEEWEKIKAHSKAGELLMGWSNLPCIAKTSHLGTRHFAHKPGQTPPLHWSETTEHLLLKAKVLEYAQELGWEAQTEVMSADRTWIADTLLTKGERTVAIEIQWSRQSLADYEFRQRRYAGDKVECYWIVKHPLKGYAREALAPIFIIQSPENLTQQVEEPRLSFNEAHDTMKGWMRKILSGDISPIKEARVKDILCKGCNRSFISFPLEIHPEKMEEAWSFSSQSFTDCAGAELKLARKGGSDKTLSCPHCSYEYSLTSEIEDTPRIGYLEGAVYLKGDFFSPRSFIDFSLGGERRIKCDVQNEVLPPMGVPLRVDWMGWNAERKKFIEDVSRFNPVPIGKKDGCSFATFNFEGFKFAVALSQEFKKPPKMPSFSEWCDREGLHPIIYGVDFAYLNPSVGGSVSLVTFKSEDKFASGFVDFEHFLMSKLVYITGRGNNNLF